MDIDIVNGMNGRNYLRHSPATGITLDRNEIVGSCLSCFLLQLQYIHTTLNKRSKISTF
jgi:hypothetical protein